MGAIKSFPGTAFYLYILQRIWYQKSNNKQETWMYVEVSIPRKSKRPQYHVSFNTSSIKEKRRAV